MRNKILEWAENQGEIPPLSDILLRLNRKIDDPGCELSEIAGLIETEPVLSGKLIKLANSVFFSGGREQANDLNTAIWRLGLKMILDLAYTLELPRMFYKCKGFDQRQFWRHSLGVAILSQNLGKQVISDKHVQQKCYLAGLMHDVGILVFFFLLSKEYSDFIKSIKESRKTLEQLEEEKFGISHPELGGFYIEKWWAIEPDVVKAVQEHHLVDWENSPDCSSVTLLANQLVNERGITNGTPASLAPLPDIEKILADWDLSLEELETMLVEMEKSLGNTEFVLDF